jgi:5-methylcytosine-specific restriction protein A
MCEAADTTARPRKIKRFNDQAVFTGGELIERDGDSWIELGELIPIEDVASAGMRAKAEQEYLEGKVKLRLHRHKERNRKAVARKKEETLKKHGKLLCEACDFDFAVFYGELGEGFVECHHRTPLASLTEESRIKLSELAIVCANCHRMLHRRPFHLVEALRKLVIDQKLFG